MFPLPDILLSQAGSALLGGLSSAKAKAGLILVLPCCGCAAAWDVWHLLAAGARSWGLQSWAQGRGDLSPPVLHSKHPDLA